MKKTFVSILLACAGIVSASGVLAQSASVHMAPAPIEVYQAFGEKAGLIKLMDDFMPRLLANPVTGPFFAPVDQTRVKEQLVEQFCQVLSGPCTYKGANMKAMHSRLEIGKAQFNALVEELQLSMNAMNIPFSAQNQLLAQLAPMHRDIVTPK